jgi:hypothetical protein
MGRDQAVACGYGTACSARASSLKKAIDFGF